MARTTLDTILLGGTALLLGYGALSFLASCIPPPDNTGPDAGADAGKPPPEGMLPPLEPYDPGGSPEHYLCSCPDQACIDDWICEQTGGVAPVCLAVQCGDQVFHFCNEVCS